MLREDLHRLIAALGADASLFEPGQLRRRIEALDWLDAHPQEPRGDALRAKLEAANAAVYESIRTRIRQGSARGALLPWIECCAGSAQTEPSGLRFDCLDELIGGLLQLREPDSTGIAPAPEMVFYQPTPVRHILHMLRLCALTQADTLIDLGSGLGHVPILASLLTGAHCIGVELEPAYIATARECARNLNQRGVEFIRQDAREADLSAATIVYLYTPFTGSILNTVLNKLREQGAHRPLRIGAFGPCTQIVAKEPWLAPEDATTAVDRVALFRTRD